MLSDTFISHLIANRVSKWLILNTAFIGTVCKPHIVVVNG